MLPIKLNLSSTLDSFQKVLDRSDTYIEIIKAVIYALEAVDQHPTLPAVEKVYYLLSCI